MAAHFSALATSRDDQQPPHPPLRRGCWAETVGMLVYNSSIDGSLSASYEGVGKWFKNPLESFGATELNKPIRFSSCQACTPWEDAPQLGAGGLGVYGRCSKCCGNPSSCLHAWIV